MERPGPEVEGESAVDRAYRLIRDSILRGSYAPGMPLRAQEVAERSGVSAIPVREALRRLEAERLVESVANKGARVAEMSFPDLADAYRLRVLLEVEAVRLALPNLTDRDLERARQLKEDMTRLLEEGPGEKGHEAHRRLHFLIYEKAGSTWLLHVISAIWDHTERYRRLVLRWGAEGWDLGRQHEEMLDALSDGDLDRAVEAVRQHFERPMRSIEEQLKREREA